MLNLNLSTCHACPHSQSNQPGFKGGACACMIDPARRDIVERAAVGDCELFTEEGRKAAKERAPATTAPAKPCSTCGKVAHGALSLLKVGAQMVGLPVDQAPRDVAAKRHRICTGCDRRNGLLCGECGCWISAKVSIKSEICPIGRW